MHTPPRIDFGDQLAGAAPNRSRPNRRRLHWLTCALLTLAASPGMAAGSEQAKGLWLSADKAAIIEFKECGDNKDALCGKIVWDKDAGTPEDACGVMIAKMKKYDDEAWRDGWVHDPRSKKNYKGVIRVKNDVLQVRAYIGTELLGETEEMTRAASLPPGCKK